MPRTSARFDLTFRTALHALLLGTALLQAVVATQPERHADDPGVSGYVLTPDDTPVSAGSVVIRSMVGARTTSPIDDAGHFRAIPNGPGQHQLVVSVSGFAPYRMNVSVPSSRALKLPPVRLSPATYFRVRFVTAAGEPITSPRLSRRSFDAAGPVTELTDDHADRVDSDGWITVGPLPRGMTTMALDMPSLAQTRLPDLYVTGEQPLLDGGTVVVGPGAVLHVDVVDQSGAPVPQHTVAIEDVRPLSPLGFRPVDTNQDGRATFERLSAGRYRVRTTAVARCGNEPLVIATSVVVPGSGTVRARLIASGRATFRITSPLGPLRGIRVSASPETGSPASPIPSRLRPGASSPAGRAFRETSCSGATDADGRVTLTDFPPGPARLDVGLLNSRYVRRVNVPVDGREIPIVVPEGFLPVRVVSAGKNDPIPAAVIAWISDGDRIEASSSATGEALLEGAGTTGGTLAVAASGYESIEEMLPEPPGVLHEVALARTRPRRLQVRVINAFGEPLGDTVVEIVSADPMEIPSVAATDPKGTVLFANAPAGSLRLTAGRDGFVTATVRVPEDRSIPVIVTLARASASP
ncbi:MAG TPA: carboxypeptidase-like regulatory domain-containing protein [Vicinamibacterales bacterium]